MISDWFKSFKNIPAKSILHVDNDNIITEEIESAPTQYADIERLANELKQIIATIPMDDKFYRDQAFLAIDEVLLCVSRQLPKL